MGGFDHVTRHINNVTIHMYKHINSWSKQHAILH